LSVSKRLAQTYVTLGQLSQAILEYEGITQEFPGDTDAKAALEKARTANKAGFRP